MAIKKISEYYSKSKKDTFRNKIKEYIQKQKAIRKIDISRFFSQNKSDDPEKEEDTKDTRETTTKEKINRFFDEAERDIETLWGTNRNYSIHYGYHDEEHKKHDDALINMNRVLAKIARIKSYDNVLDAGCGVGGSAIWLAKNLGTQVIGISTNKMHIKKAREYATQNKVNSLTKFYVRDYIDTKFQENSFDVVLSIESVVFEEDKEDFLKEAKKILKPNGRLVIADIFRKEKPTEEEKTELDLWLSGWIVQNLAKASTFKENLKDQGFKNIKFMDATANITPSSRRMYIGSIFAYPIYRFLELIRLKTRTQTRNIASAYRQYRALKKGLWRYYIFYAEK